MNAALIRPALNMTILVSVVFHLAVLYYLATAWSIIPSVTPQVIEPPAIPVYQPPPPPPKPPEPEPVHPIVSPRLPLAPPVPSPVPPIPLPPQPPAPSSPNGPLIMNSTVPDVPTSIVKPLYPEIALRQEREGHVRLSITILPDGSVTDVQVISAAPPGYFEQSAIEAVKRWHYKPTGTTRTHVYVDIDYQLTG